MEIICFNDKCHEWIENNCRELTNAGDDDGN
jgi:hypothetical protein